MNEILFYKPGLDACSVGYSQIKTDITVDKTDTTNTIYHYLTSTSLSTNGDQPLSAAQAAGVMGNFYVESRFNPAAIEVTDREQKGHGLAQWTFGRWDNLSNFANEQGKSWDDLSLQLDFLKLELEGSEQAVLNNSQFTSSDPSITAQGWRVAFERADPALAHDERRIGAAVAIFNLYGGASASCLPTAYAVTGDIVKTSLNLALPAPAPNGMVAESDARDTYREAKTQLNPSVDWTDCGGFVATVLFASEVDKDYPNVSVAAQRKYVEATSSKYTIFEKPTIDTLQPGDILFIDGHTAIYTGESQYPMVDASLGERVPSVRNLASLMSMLDGENAMAARAIK